MTPVSDKLLALVSEHQATLLHISKRFFPRGSIPRNIRRAFLDTPRHVFTPIFYSCKKGQWTDTSASSLAEILSELYEDHPLGIYRDELGRTLSTISQPSLVLLMLDLLKLEPGMKVFELGCGSGWNAAMMGRLVSPGGRVVSLEIIDELAKSASKGLERLGIKNVTVLSADGNLGQPSEAPFQRGVFTASAWDLPHCFFQQIEMEGILLLVIRIKADLDLLAVLRKTSENRFHSECHFPCSFVPVVGTHTHPKFHMIDASHLSELGKPKSYRWDEVKISKDSIPKFISFAELVMDCQTPYLVDSDHFDYHEEYSGFYNKTRSSLVLFNEEQIKLLGEEDALIELRRAGKRWLKADMPEMESLNLSIYPKDSTPPDQKDQWIVQRGDSALCWRI